MKNIRKISLLLTFIFIFTVATSSFTFALDPQPEPPAPISILLDNKKLELDANPTIINGRTLVPMRILFESLGATIEWDDVTKTVTAKKGVTTIKLSIGKSVAYVTVGNVTSNVKLDAEPCIQNERTLVPVRFVSESLGLNVDWVDSTRTVILSSQSSSSNDTSSSTTNTGSSSGDTSNSNNQTGTEQPKLDFEPKIPDISNIFKSALITTAKEPKNYLQDSITNAIPFDKSKLINSLPSSLDYSEYISLTRNQGVAYDSYNKRYCGIGWCYDMANMHCTDIIKEMENKYTPDLSLWYLRYNDAKLYTEGMINGNQEKVLSDGICTETSLPSDYIHARVDPVFDTKYSYKKDANGNIVTYLNLDPMPKPTDDDIQEARGYRITKNSEINDPKTDEIKSLLYKYGPIWACGPYQSILGENPSEYHVMTIVGYDDSKQTFKMLNSWGNKWNGSGFIELPYSNVDKEISSIQYFENIPSDRSGTKAYSGRVVIEHPLRNQLFVEVGVEGKTPLIVWMGPNRGKEVGIYDNSMNLVYDFPLPDYAKDCWPPSNTNKWYVRVGDNKTDSYMGYLKSFTLAHIKDNTNNKSVDKTTIETYTQDFDNTSGKILQYNYYCDIGTKFYYTPDAANNLKIPETTYSFTITSGNKLENEKPAAFTMNGVLNSQFLGISTAASMKDVGVYELIQGPCVNIPAKWVLRATVKTDSVGKFSYTFTPTGYGMYWYGFAVTDSNNKVVASSEPTVIRVGPILDEKLLDLKNIPRIIPDKINPNLGINISPNFNPNLNTNITLPNTTITPSITPSIIPSITPSISPSISPSIKPSISPSISTSISSGLKR